MHYMPRGKYPLRALSVVELLIVIAIIGMLVSLLVPAISASREAARKSSCLDNTRQIGLAIHQYHSATRTLPPSRIRDRFLTWAALILPYVDQTDIADQIQSDLTFAEQSEVVRSTPLGAFLCPSRHHEDILVDVRDVPGVKGDYAAMTSTFVLGGDYGKHFDGAMITGDAKLLNNGTIDTWKSRTSIDDIKDGLSKTILIVESSLWMADRAALFDGNYNTGAILGDSLYPTEYVHLAKKIRWHPIAFSESQPQTCVGSAHPNVIYVAMGDGSSHAINKDIDVVVAEHLVTRAGGEATSLADVGAK
jgi:type II secretory pathway pseudopilin PulG